MNSEKDQLSDERNMRVQYSTIYRSIVDWLKAAEDSVQEDYQGIDFEILEEKLALHKVNYVQIQ